MSAPDYGSGRSVHDEDLSPLMQRAWEVMRTEILPKLRERMYPELPPLRRHEGL